jgi:hypothetical protein
MLQMNVDDSDTSSDVSNEKMVTKETVSIIGSLNNNPTNSSFKGS